MSSDGRPTGATGQPALALDGVGVDRGGVRVVRDVALELAPGGALALLGPSGSGKSSLLHAVAGLVPVATGSVHVAGRDVDGVPPERRGVGLMFQEFALFPHLDVAANVGFGPRMHGVGADERERRTAGLLDQVGLDGLGGRDVATLSGGQRQRVALARALATDPDLLLLDEPFGALDRQLREQLLGEVQQLVAGEDGPAVVAVTHDRDEAFTLGDEVVVLREGRVAQHGTPDELWARPADAWTARFLGHPNVLPPADAAAFGLRADRTLLVPVTALRLDPDGERRATVVGSTWRGGRVRCRLDVDGVVLELDVAPGSAPVRGAQVRLAVEGERMVELPEGSW